MLPFHLIRSARYTRVMIETKLGDTYEGKIEDMDKFMDIHLQDVIITSADGEKFYKVGYYIFIQTHLNLLPTG